MADVKLTQAGQYSIVDLESVGAKRTGMGVYSQELELDATDFATAVAENGMCLVVKGKTVALPDAVGDKVLLHATECEIYEEGKGRNTFAVKRGKGSQPRLFELNGGDYIATNAAMYVDTEFATVAALKTAIAGGTVYAIPTTSGLWKLTATTTGATVKGLVVDFVALSNEEAGVRIRF